MGDVRNRGAILVVEDSDDVLDAVQAGLRTLGYRVLAAHDGVKALTLLASTSIDVIVLDLSMPIMSGWELLDARRGDPWLAAIPVVVLSAVNPDLEGPWNAFVEKPFVLEQLVAAIERCRGSSARRDTPSAS